MASKDKGILAGQKKWDNLSRTWALTAPPAVPSSNDISNFHSLILKHCSGSNPVAIILGSTISLRKIFIEDSTLNHVKVHCIDWSKKMYQQLTKVGQINNPNETFHHDNWLSMNINRLGADIILGDKSIDNVPYNKWPLFFQNCSNHLEKNKALVLHVGLVTEKFRVPSFEFILKKWKEKFEKNSLSLADAASGIWEDCLTSSAFLDNVNDHKLSISKWFPQIENYYQEVTLNNDGSEKLLMDFFFKYFSVSFKDVWTSFDIVDIKKLSDRYFEVSNILWSFDYDVSDSQPIIELLNRT